jgi:ribosome-binding protein aMBF1 (putative translation factor)
MSRTYEEIAAERRAKLDPGSNEHTEVFEQAYRIAMQVVELRERHGLTQSQLAEKCGMDQADISRIERGSTSPTTRVLQRIADALDADLKLVARAS